MPRMRRNSTLLKLPLLCNSTGVKPELGETVVPPDMHVGRLASVARDKVEPETGLLLVSLASLHRHPDE